MQKRGHAAETVLAAVIAACGIAPALGAAPDKEYSFNIPKQPLSQAILAFDTQAGLSGGVVSDTREEASVIVGPLRGPYTADKALRELLKNTDFEYEWISGDTISVYKKISSGKANAQTTGPNPLPTSLLYQEHGGLGDWGSPEDILLVISTRLSGPATEAQSTEVLTRQKIESSGASTVPELLAIIPQIPFMRTPDFRQSGEQYADLRGLGPNATLVLLNGRRLPPTATSYDTGGFDLNMIPLTAVKRIEIVLNSPSIVAGGDAPGGIVNIVLKNDAHQPVAEVSYGGASGGAQERRASLTFGGTAGEIFRGAATLDVYNRDRLLGTERDLTRSGDFRSYGGVDWRSPQATPGNVMSTLPGNLPGLNSSFAAVPMGSAGVQTPADFVATSGELNRTGPLTFHSIVPDSTRASLVASGDLMFSMNLIAFAELLAVNKKAALETGPAGFTAVVPVSNPYNQFGAPVTVSTLLHSAPAQEDVNDTTFTHALAGVRGNWHDWQAEMSVASSVENTKVQLENRLDPSRLTQALSAADPDDALNVFQDGPAGSAHLLASLMASPETHNYTADTLQLSGRVQGPVLTTPAGSATLTAGVEWRRERDSMDALTNVPERTVSSSFAEVQVPLLSAPMDVPAVRDLSLSLGIRRDNYSDFATQLTPQYGLVWRPFADLKIRAAYSQGYTLPTLFYMYAPPVSTVFPLQDAHRHNEVANVAVHYQGNPDLRVAPSRSWTASLEFAPETIPALRISANYWRTRIDDYIVGVPIAVFAAHDDLFPGRSVRAAPTPQDVAAGMPGALQSLDVSLGNFSLLETSGFDFNMSLGAETSLGRLTSNLSATLTDTYSLSWVSGLSGQERVGIASEYGTIPRWRATASLEWARGPLQIFTATRFVSHYDDALVGIRTGNTIPSRTLVDAQISISAGEWASRGGALDGLKLSAGATNVFDVGPHFAQVGYYYGYDYSQGDLRGRVWYLRLTKEF